MASATLHGQIGINSGTRTHRVEGESKAAFFVFSLSKKQKTTKIRRMANEDKDCYELMADATKVIDDMKQYDKGYSDFDLYLSGIRTTIEDTVRDIKAGKPLPRGFLGQWDFSVTDSLDHMLSVRLAGMPRKANGEPNFINWNENDVALYKLFDKLTLIVETLIETCKPENEARIAASRAAKGLPNVAARRRARRAAKVAAVAERKAATRKARVNAERAAGEALLAANNGRSPKRNVSRKKGNNSGE